MKEHFILIVIKYFFILKWYRKWYNKKEIEKYFI